MNSRGCGCGRRRRRRRTGGGSKHACWLPDRPMRLAWLLCAFNVADGGLGRLPAAGRCTPAARHHKGAPHLTCAFLQSLARGLGGPSATRRPVLAASIFCGLLSAPSACCSQTRRCASTIERWGPPMGLVVARMGPKAHAVARASPLQPAEASALIAQSRHTAPARCDAAGCATAPLRHLQAVTLAVSAPNHFINSW